MILRTLPAALACAALLPATAAAAAKPLTMTRIAGTTPAAAVDPETPQAEIAAYHAGTDRIFATNTDADRLEVYEHVLNPQRIASLPLNGGPNSVAVRPDGLVAVAVESDPKTDPGSVEFFNAATLARVGSAPAGALPDMLTFTSDGGSVLVANEGEPNDAYTVDPEGSVTIVDAFTFESTQVRFAPAKDYEGIRVYGPGATPPQDFEPEYIAADPDGRLAYVTLQENNAVAILDLERRRFRSVRPLGLKDWGASALDAGDRDGVGQDRIVPRPNLHGMYEPDAIAAYSVKSKTYLVTANEGDARDYDGFAEESRVSALDLDETAFPPAQASALSRLNVTTTEGDDDGDGDYDRLLTLGGRSMSIWSHALELSHDTGDELERQTLARTPALFNADHGPALEPDNRSDNKGPEPEGVTVGTVAGRQYAFLGLERHSGVVAYDLSDKAGGASVAALAHNRPVDRGPEGIVFVPAAESPNGMPLLLVTNETTSTVGVWQVTPAV